MPSPEQILHRPVFFYLPDKTCSGDSASSSAGQESPNHVSLPEAPPARQISSSSPESSTGDLSVVSSVSVPHFYEPGEEDITNPRDYYERLLRKMYPHYDDEEINRLVEIGIQDEALCRFLSKTELLDRELREEYPEKNWTTWIDRLKPE